jgi:hypothetical protein
MVAQRTVNALVGGSNPSPRAKKKFRKIVDGSVGWCKLSVFFRCVRSSTVEHRPFKPVVVDSNSTGRTNFVLYHFN